jgi:hypothetical protein
MVTHPLKNHTDMFSQICGVDQRYIKQFMRAKKYIFMIKHKYVFMIKHKYIFMIKHKVPIE